MDTSTKKFIIYFLHCIFAACNLRCFLQYQFGIAATSWGSLGNHPVHCACTQIVHFSFLCESPLHPTQGLFLSSLALYLISHLRQNCSLCSFNCLAVFLSCFSFEGEDIIKSWGFGKAAADVEDVEGVGAALRRFSLLEVEKTVVKLPSFSHLVG